MEESPITSTFAFKVTGFNSLFRSFVGFGWTFSVQLSQRLYIVVITKNVCHKTHSSAVFFKDITQNHFLRDKDPFLKSGHTLLFFCSLLFGTFLMHAERYAPIFGHTVRSVSHLYIAVARG